MGPDKNHIEQVKLDAHIATLRHFRDDALDNNYVPAKSFDETDKEVRAQLGRKPAEEAPKRGRKPAVPSSNVPAEPSDTPSNVVSGEEAKR